MTIWITGAFRNKSTHHAIVDYIPTKAGSIGFYFLHMCAWCKLRVSDGTKSSTAFEVHFLLLIFSSTSGLTTVVGELNKLLSKFLQNCLISATLLFSFTPHLVPHKLCQFWLQLIIRSSSRTICITLTHKRVFTKSNRLYSRSENSPMPPPWLV